MAAKKPDPNAQPLNPQMGGMPAQPGMAQPGMMPGQPGMMPGQMPMGGMPGMPMMQNPMFAFMQMMQAFQQGPQGGYVDPAAMPFSMPEPVQDTDQGLDAEIIRPALLENRVKTQQAVPMGSVLDVLCLDENGEKPLGGIPQGCTIAFAGPPGKGKTRTVLAGLCQVALAGTRCAFIVAEEGFHDEEGSGRDDLCSRLEKIGRAVTGLSEKDFADKVLSNVYVLESQYHKGNSWDDFVTKYRYLVEKEQIKFVVIDSLNMLDPSKNRTADNLSALKTYNHAKGITCLCVGQIRDTGGPVGGEALQHTADAVFLLEEMSLTSKEMAATWGGSYRDKIDILRAVKSVTTPTFPHPIRVTQNPGSGELVVHDSHPEEFAVPS